MMTMRRRSALAAVGLLFAAQIAVATPQPAPPYPPSPPPPNSDTSAPAPAPVYRGPARGVDPTPPPLSPAMRAIYAPFYVTGLVFRYGFYYLFVAPFEVFGRTVTYGVEGGIPKRQPQPDQAPPEDSGK